MNWVKKLWKIDFTVGIIGKTNMCGYSQVINETIGRGGGRVFGT